jgi:hypothetical protein
MAIAINRPANPVRRLPLRWWTVGILAVVLAYMDGFWLTALQGAIGAIERAEEPFVRFVRDATLMLPLVFLAIALALFGARRLVERRRSALARFAVVALLVAAVAGVVGIAEAAFSSYRDYQYQTRHLEEAHGVIPSQLGVDGVLGPGAETSPAYFLYCNLRGATATSAVALMEYATFLVHVRALGVMSVLLLVSNLVVVTLLLALLPGKLWSEPSGR